MFFSGTKPFSSISAETRCLSHKSLETNWSNRANGTSKAARHTTSSKPMALVSPMQGIRFKALNMFLFACRALDTMAFNAKTALLASLFVLVLAFLFKPVELLVHAFTKTYFEGNSFGKSLAFFGWLLLYFGVLHLKDHGRLPAFFLRNPHPFHWFLYMVCLASLTGFFLHFLVLYTTVPGFTLQDSSSIVGTLIGSGDRIEWEASYLGHTHEGKIALSQVTQWLGAPLKYDTGRPMYAIVPFAALFSLALLVMLFFAAYFALQEGLAAYSGQHNVRPMLWGIVSFGLLVVMLDGNFFTAASQLLIGLLLFYWLKARSGLALKPWQEFLYPLFGTGGILFLGSYLFGATIAATYAFSVLAFSLLCLVLFLRRFAVPHRVVWLLLLLFFGYHTFHALLGTGFGRVLHPGEKAVFFVYGVPADARDPEIAGLLAPHLDEVVVERHGWIAFFRGTVKSLTAAKFLETSLTEGLGPQGYLFVVYLRDQEY